MPLLELQQALVSAERQAVEKEAESVVLLSFLSQEEQPVLAVEVAIQL